MHSFPHKPGNRSAFPCLMQVSCAWQLRGTKAFREVQKSSDVLQASCSVQGYFLINFLRILLKYYWYLFSFASITQKRNLHLKRTWRKCENSLFTSQILFLTPEAVIYNFTWADGHMQKFYLFPWIIFQYI